jgi:hypothetical protein
VNFLSEQIVKLEKRMEAQALSANVLIDKFQEDISKHFSRQLKVNSVPSSTPNLKSDPMVNPFLANFLANPTEATKSHRMANPFSAPKCHSVLFPIPEPKSDSTANLCSASVPTDPILATKSHPMANLFSAPKCHSVPKYSATIRLSEKLLPDDELAMDHEFPTQSDLDHMMKHDQQALKKLELKSVVHA